MHEVVHAAKRAFLVLNRTGIDYAVCGGLAVGAHGHIRGTDDVDVVVRSRADCDIALAALAEDGWIINPSETVFPDGFILRRAVLAIGRQAIPLDLLIPPPDMDVLTGRERSEVDSCACWVVSKDRLLAMKRSAGRLQDLADIERLNQTPP